MRPSTPRRRGPAVLGFAMALLCLGAARAGAPKAVAVYARGDYAGVVKLLEPGYRAGTAKIQERLLLARAWLHLRRPDDALAALRAVLDSDRENPEANGLAGQLLLQAGKHKEAIACLDHAYRLKQDPTTAAALGQCHHALGQNTKAKVYLEKALKEDVRNPANSFLLGKICLERGLGALAEKYLLMAQEAGLDTPELHLLLGRAYLLQRKVLGPIRVRRIARQAEVGDLVDSRVVLGKLDGVADHYKVCTRFSALYEGITLLEHDPNHPDALHMVAAGYLAAGQTALAERSLAALARREPGSQRVAHLQARLLLAARRYDALERFLDSPAAKKHFDPRAAADLCYRAAIDLRAAGQRDAAARLLQKAEGYTPTAGNVLHSLAGLAVATGRAKDAAGYYARMVELYPDAPDLDEWRNALKVLERQTGGPQ